MEYFDGLGGELDCAHVGDDKSIRQLTTGEQAPPAATGHEDLDVRAGLVVKPDLLHPERRATMVHFLTAQQRAKDNRGLT
jgi:hypothetical protein